MERLNKVVYTTDKYTDKYKVITDNRHMQSNIYTSFLNKTNVFCNSAGSMFTNIGRVISYRHMVLYDDRNDVSTYYYYGKPFIKYEWKTKKVWLNFDYIPQYNYLPLHLYIETLIFEKLYEQLKRHDEIDTDYHRIGSSPVRYYWTISFMNENIGKRYLIMRQNTSVTIDLNDPDYGIHDILVKDTKFINAHYHRVNAGRSAVKDMILSKPDALDTFEKLGVKVIERQNHHNATLTRSIITYNAEYFKNKISMMVDIHNEVERSKAIRIIEELKSKYYGTTQTQYYLEIPEHNEAVKYALLGSGYDLAGSVVYKMCEYRVVSNIEVRIDGAYLFGKEYTGQVWMHRIPPMLWNASIDTCERWILNISKDDKVVEET